MISKDNKFLKEYWYNLSKEKQEQLKVVFTWTLIPLFILISVSLAFMFVRGERVRVLNDWQANLRIVNDGRAKAVSDFIDDKYKALEKIADNVSVKMYLTELLSKKDTSDKVEAKYLRSYLEKVAVISGFRKQGYVAFDDSLNTPYFSNDGIVILNNKADPVVSISNMPSVSFLFLEKLRMNKTNNRMFYDMHLNDYGKAVMSFAVPVFSLQDSAKNSAKKKGYILGVYEVGEKFFSLLNQEGDIYKTTKNYLVRRNGDMVEYISPIRGEGLDLVLKNKLSITTPGLASSYIFKDENSFGIRLDYNGEKVLSVGNKFDNLPWYIIRKVSYKEALGSTDKRLFFLFMLFFILICSVSLFIVLVWRKGASVRLEKALEVSEKSYSELQRNTKFLHLLANSQVDEIAVFDKNNKYIFVNKKAAHRVGSIESAVVGKSLDNMIGGLFAKELILLNEKARKGLKPVSKMHKIGEGKDSEVVLKSIHVPLDDKSVLVTFHNLTEIMEEKEKSHNVMFELMKLLVSILSLRDSVGAYKTIYIEEVAMDIASEMELDKDEKDSLQLSCYLVDVHHFLVSKNLVLKDDMGEKLNKKEFETMYGAVDKISKLVEQVEIHLPISDVLRQRFEKFDGSGKPKGLKGSDILVSAKILALADFFVNKVAYKSTNHRSLMKSFNEALNEIMLLSGKDFDPSVVSAFLNYANNRGGIDKWEHFSIEKKSIISKIESGKF